MLTAGPWASEGVCVARCHRRSQAEELGAGMERDVVQFWVKF